MIRVGAQVLTWMTAAFCLLRGLPCSWKGGSTLQEMWGQRAERRARPVIASGCKSRSAGGDVKGRMDAKETEEVKEKAEE